MSFDPSGTLVQGTAGFSKDDLQLASYRNNSGTVSVAVVGPNGTSVTVGGNVADNAADSGNPVKVGGIYQGTAQTYASGDRFDLQGDVNGNVKVTLATQLAGEDLTNDVAGILMKPVASSTYSPSTHTNFGASSGTGVAVKAAAGNVFSVYVTSGTTAQRYFQIFDSATAVAVGGTPIASYPIGVGSVLAGDVAVLQLDTTHFAPSLYCSTGIACAISSTQGTLGTASITAADYSWHIKYV